jgi:hypothetical protein
VSELFDGMYVKTRSNRTQESLLFGRREHCDLDDVDRFSAIVPSEQSLGPIANARRDREVMRCGMTMISRNIGSYAVPPAACSDGRQVIVSPTTTVPPHRA